MTRTRPHLAVLYRSPYLLVALAQDGRVLELRRHRLAPLAGARRRLKSLLGRYAALYRPSGAIVEPGRKPGRAAPVEAAVRALPIPYRTLRLAEAMLQVGKGLSAPHPSAPTFYDVLVAAQPELRRFVRILPGTGRVARTEHWKLGMLQVATVALAGTAEGPSPLSPTPALARRDEPRRTNG